MLNLINLDDQTRRFMLEELTYDLHHGSLYYSPRLTPAGVRNYPRLLQEAIANHNDFWLESELRAQECIRTTEVHHNGRGASVVTVPANAAQSLAEEEFNRYYIRGVCRRAIASAIPEVAVYRAKAAKAKPTNEEPIDRTINATALLAELRKHPDLGEMLGMATGSASGLSVYLPNLTG